MTGVDLELGGVAVRAGDLPLLRRSPDGLASACGSRSPRRSNAAARASRSSRPTGGPSTPPPPSSTEARRSCGCSPRPSTGRRSSGSRASWTAARGAATSSSSGRSGAGASTSSTTRTSTSATPTRRRRPASPPRVPRLRARPRCGGRRLPLDGREQPAAGALARGPAAGDAREMLGHLRSGRFEACALPFTMHAEAASIDELARQLRFAAELRGARRRDRDGHADRRAGRAAGPAARARRGRRALPRGRAQLGLPRGAVPDRRRDAAAGVLLGDRERQARARLAHRQPARHRVPRGQPARARRRRTATPSTCCPSTSLRSRCAATRTPARTRRSACRGPGPARRIRSTCCICAYRDCSPTTPGRARAGRDRGGMGERVRVPGARSVDEPRVLRGARGAPRRRPRDVRRRLGRLVGRRSRLGRARGRLQPPRAGDRADGADAAGDGGRAHRRRAPARSRGRRRLRAHGALRRAHLVRGAPGRRRAHRPRVGRRCSGRRRQRSRSRRRDRAEALLGAAAARFRSDRSDSHPRAQPERPPAERRRRHLPAGAPCRPRPAVVDVERGERVPHALGPPEPSRNRPQGRLLSFVARDVPGLGYRRFELVADDAARRGGGAGHARERALPPRARRRGRLRDGPPRPRARARARRRRERVRLRAGRARPLRRAASTATRRAFRRAEPLRIAGADAGPTR